MKPPRMELEVVEWPTTGAARRPEFGGWWLVETRIGRGYTPIAGPFRTQREADDAMAAERKERKR